MTPVNLRQHVLASLLAVVCGLASAAAQVSDSAASGSAPPAWCASAAAGIMARVNTGTRGSHIGPVLHCDAAAIVLGETLGQDAPEYTVPTMFVRKVWVRRTSGRIGFVLGAVSGGAVGGILAGLKSELCPNPSANPFQSQPLNCHGNIPLGIAAGAAAGGLLGWALGQALPGWKRVYP